MPADDGDVEIAVLRHQLKALHRQGRSRSGYGPTDRLILAPTSPLPRGGAGWGGPRRARATFNRPTRRPATAATTDEGVRFDSRLMLPLTSLWLGCEVIP